MKACNKCGIALEDDDQFCPECGSKASVVKDTEKPVKKRKITLLSLVKFIFKVFIVFIAIAFISNGAGAIVFLALAITLWTPFFRRLLSRHNIELSRGVKIVITIVIILLLIASLPKDDNKTQGRRAPTNYEITDNNQIMRLFKEQEKAIMDRNVAEYLSMFSIKATDSNKMTGIKFVENANIQRLRLYVNDVQIKGNRATAILSIPVEFNDNRKNVFNMKVSMVKEKDGWKILQQDFDTLKKEMKKQPTEIEEVAEENIILRER